jgi:hypothetical protein
LPRSQRRAVNGDFDPAILAVEGEEAKVEVHGDETVDHHDIVELDRTGDRDRARSGTVEELKSHRADDAAEGLARLAKLPLIGDRRTDLGAAGERARAEGGQVDGESAEGNDERARGTKHGWFPREARAKQRRHSLKGEASSGGGESDRAEKISSSLPRCVRDARIG